MFTFIAGLLFPGLGHWIHKKWLSGLLVSAGIFTPLLWSLFMTTQSLNDRILAPQSKPLANILDGQIFARWSELPALPAHIVVLLVGTLILHVLAAKHATKGL